MRCWYCRMLSALLMFVVVPYLACSGNNVKQEEAVEDASSWWYEKTAEDVPLQGNYQSVALLFSTTPQIQTDYPDALYECEESAIDWLEHKRGFQNVRRQKPGEANIENDLLVKVFVPEMRIVSASARFWFGFTVGSSYMNMEVQLIDAASGKVLREKNLSTTANAFASAYSRGATDRSMTEDMGKMLGDYIFAVVESSAQKSTP